MLSANGFALHNTDMQLGAQSKLPDNGTKNHIAFGIHYVGALCPINQLVKTPGNNNTAGRLCTLCGHLTNTRYITLRTI